MATFQTMNDKQVIRHYVTPRTRREAGIGTDELLEDAEFVTKGFAGMVAVAVLTIIGAVFAAAVIAAVMWGLS